MLLVKFLVLLLLGFVIVSLFSGLFFLVKDKGQTNRTVNALSLRIGLSIVAVVIIMIAGATGVIELNPNPLMGESAEPIGDGVDPDAGANNSGLPAGENPTDPAGSSTTESGSGRRRIEE